MVYFVANYDYYFDMGDLIPKYGTSKVIGLSEDHDNIEQLNLMFRQGLF